MCTRVSVSVPSVEVRGHLQELVFSPTLDGLWYWSQVLRPEQQVSFCLWLLSFGVFRFH